MVIVANESGSMLSSGVYPQRRSLSFYFKALLLFVCMNEDRDLMKFQHGVLIVNIALVYQANAGHCTPVPHSQAEDNSCIFA